MYFGTIISVVSAFVWAICNPDGLKNRIGKLIEYIGKNLSMIVYFIHVIVATYLQYFVSEIVLRGGGEAQFVQTLFPVIVIISTIIISEIIYRMKLILSHNHRFSIVYTMAIAIGLSLLILPTGSEWRMLTKITSPGVTSIQEVFEGESQSALLVTVQDSNGVTVDAVEIPVVQFIGGGISRKMLVNGSEESYSATYVNGSTVDFEKTDGVQQVRIWAK